MPTAPRSPATTGLGVQRHVVARPRATKLNDFDNVSAFVELRSAQGSLGTYLLSGTLPPQSFRFEDRTYQLVIRDRRDYKPFSLKLLDFSFDRYPGTEIAKNYSSRVVREHPAAGEDREVLIYMNNPLRYGGYTFYQASFNKGETTTISRW